MVPGRKIELRWIADAEQRVAAHQFLSAARAVHGAPPPAGHLDHGMALLWIPRIAVSGGKLQLSPVLNRTKVALMKSTTVAWLCLVFVVLASVAVAQAPGDARRGGILLREAECLDCHTFDNAGKGTAPD